MVIGKMIKPTVMESTTTLMVLAMKVGGLKINNMEKERKYGQTMLAMKDSTKMERNTVTESSYGLMDRLILVILLTITYMAKVSTLGLTVVNTTVNGTTIKCTDLEFLPGTMVESTRANTLMTKSKVTVYLHGQMVVSMMVNGEMESSMVLASTFQARVKLRKANGQKENAFNGLMKPQSEN